MHYFLKLVPSRPTFAQDMNDEERRTMQKHVEYWQGLLQRGKVVVYGPVMDPAGAYGIGIVDVDSENEVRSITENDPAATINRYEIAPMRAIMAPH